MSSSEYGLKMQRKKPSNLQFLMFLPEVVIVVTGFSKMVKHKNNISTSAMEDQPFADLKIDGSAFLDEVDGREACSKCGKSRKYYCYTCFLPVPRVADKIPKIKLPLKVDIIKHPDEVDGKSTAAHAAVMAPDDVTVYTFPCIPDYKKREKVLLLFPCEESLTFEQYVEKHRGSSAAETPEPHASRPATSKRTHEEEGNHTEDSAAKRLCVGNDETDTDKSSESVKSASVSQTKPECPFERVVFIDSTWYQVKKISNDERLNGLQRIEIKSHKTKFWRHQKDKPDTYLATIEAIYYFIREFHDTFVEGDSAGVYDNLLFFFAFMYDKIKHLYHGKKELKAYKKKDKK